MQTENFLREITAVPGLSGNEAAVAHAIADAFRPCCDEVRIDALNSVIGHIQGSGPKVMLCAHLDEIGLIVADIEKDGAVRFSNVGGVDPRILPGMRVTVYAKETLMGVVGAKAPHLLTDKEKKKNYRREDLFIDLGMSPERVKSLVQVGDLISLEVGVTSLLNGRLAGKTMDDRSCVAILLRAMERLKKMDTTADLYFVASCQEEIGGYGAMTSAYGIDPDFAVVLDVTHAKTPGAPDLEVFDLTAPVAAKGPYLNPYLRDRLAEVAKEINVTLQDEIVPRYTSTDADDITISRCGVPTVLIELPVKYMHTSVELLDLHALEESARLLAAFCAAIEDRWRDEIWI
ncbi:MAG: M20/M25/M40 family metallo-hydrolase [Clostridia bacterium]|nr:M20/M25/M40 family metallo-hydrolase [Clostridia bacterium]